MDAQAIYVVIGGASFVLTLGIFIGSRAVVQRDVASLDKAVHKLNERMSVIPAKPDEVYARKDVIAPKLEAIDASLKRIEMHQEMMAARFMNGGMGAP